MMYSQATTMTHPVGVANSQRAILLSITIVVLIKSGIMFTAFKSRLRGYTVVIDKCDIA
jgi:hypothetical protein